MNSIRMAELSLGPADVEDVVAMPLLNEQVILEVLCARYNISNIYTNAGDVLLAVNPFANLPLYTKTILQSYREANKSSLKALSPHPWKTATKAFMQMMRQSSQVVHRYVKHQPELRDQSVLITGESGAGKTETTKIIMSYLAKSTWGDGSAEEARDLGQIQQRVLQANPILEAFGNARTVRNDNSSRFGKYIKLFFDAKSDLRGAALETFLLETTRVVKHSALERNFHIFYMLCASHNYHDTHTLHVQAPEYYFYLNQSECYVRRDGVSDRSLFRYFCDSMKTLGFERNDVNSLFKIVMSILCIGNVNFESKTGPSGDIIINLSESSEDYMARVVEYLGVTHDTLFTAITTRKVSVVGELFNVTLTSDQAEETRDIFAKTLYSSIFQWVLDCLNANMRVTGNENYGIFGLLDIFGFESLATNSIEQLLINYANECLQLQFDATMIEAEQQLYIEEGIQWDFIEFPSTKDCIELISDKKISILALLDEACIAPSGSDTSFARQIYVTLKNHPRLSLTAIGIGKMEFGVQHYAGVVAYDSKDFVVKNKNRIFPLSSVLSNSSNEFLSKIFDSPIEVPRNKNRSSKSKMLFDTISNTFKDNLQQLIGTIESTEAHYIKCLKPNSENIKNSFDLKLVDNQLRCGGIMQTIRVIRAGFPVRFTHEQFCANYNAIIRYLGIHERIQRQSPSYSDASPKVIIEHVMSYLHAEILKRKLMSGLTREANVSLSTVAKEIGIQIGKSMVFLRHDSHLVLENIHNSIAGKSALRIQTAFRRHVHSAAYSELRSAAMYVQKTYRCFICRRAWRRIQPCLRIIVRFLNKKLLKWRYIRIERQSRAIHIIQRVVRAFTKRHHYHRLRKSARCLQRWRRGKRFCDIVARSYLMIDLFSEIVVTLQRRWRDRCSLNGAIRQRKSMLFSSTSIGLETDENTSFFKPSVPAYLSVKGFVAETPVVDARYMLKYNTSVLWPIFTYYAPNKVVVPSINLTHNKRDIIPLVPAMQIIALCKDWDIIPTMLSAYRAMEILESIADKKKKNAMYSFSNFKLFILTLAANIVGMPSPVFGSALNVATRDVLTIMDRSGGRSKFVRNRNAVVISSFTGVTGSAPVPQQGMQAQGSSIKEVQERLHTVMTPEIQKIMRKNEITLKMLLHSYSSTTTIPSKTKGTDVIVSFDNLSRLMHDFGVCPGFCTKPKLHSFYNEIVVSGEEGISLHEFMELLDFVAQDMPHSQLHADVSREIRMKRIFQAMNSSNGRSKLARANRNALVIPPLTLPEDAADAANLYSNSPPLPPRRSSRANSSTSPHVIPKRISAPGSSSSTASPLLRDSRRKSLSSMTPPLPPEKRKDPSLLGYTIPSNGKEKMKIGDT